ncbi:MAG: type II toxin-antitoxin system RelB/DinJ family antitoxin [Acidobacteriaceae bacterium]
MPATATVHIRVDEKVKQKATKALDAMGLSISDAVRLLLVRVAAEKALPFEVKVPNRQTRAAMEAGERGEVSRASSVEEMMADLNAND